MNIKRAFLTAVAVLMVPGLAMAQTVTFPTSVSPAEAGNPDLTLTCNGGLPLTQTAPAGTTFSLTEAVAGIECSIVMASDLESGYETDTVCEYVLTEATEYPCDIVATAIPVDFEVTVMWEVSEEADPGVGGMTEVALYCKDMSNMGYTSTTMDAAPGDDMPVALEVVPPASCHAYLMGVGSAVEVDDSDCDSVSIDVGAGESCTIYATAFYEGIPTLSQYGMAIMVLLMLGVGFVGFRRIV